jgi:hypothetical protein
MKQPSLFPGIKPIEIKKSVIRPTTLLGPKSKPIGYRKYIQSFEWRQKALAAKKYYGNKCQECGHTENLEVHHLDYPNSLYKERYCDVKVLCKRSCHRIADSTREVNEIFDSYLYTRYGDDFYLYYDDERTLDEFDEWLESKD